MDMEEYEDDGDEFEVKQPSPEAVAEAQERLRALEEAAQKIGLYQQHYRIGYTTDEDDNPSEVVLIVDYIAGDVAWSNRIQAPEEDEIDKQFKDIAAATEETDFEAYRRRLQEKKGLDEIDG